MKDGRGVVSIPCGVQGGPGMGGISLLLIPRGPGLTTKLIKTSYSAVRRHAPHHHLHRAPVTPCPRLSPTHPHPHPPRRPVRRTWCWRTSRCPSRT